MGATPDSRPKAPMTAKIVAKKIARTETKIVSGMPPRMYGPHSERNVESILPVDMIAMTNPPTRTSQVRTNSILNWRRLRAREAATAATTASGVAEDRSVYVTCGLAISPPGTTRGRPSGRPRVASDGWRALRGRLRVLGPEPLLGHGAQRAVGVHVGDDLVEHRHEVGGRRTALVGGHRQRLVVDGSADLDERQARLEGAVDDGDRGQPPVEVEPAGLPLVGAVRVGRQRRGLDARGRLAQVLAGAVVQLAVEPLVVGRALAGADRLAGEAVKGRDAGVDARGHLCGRVVVRRTEVEDLRPVDRRGHRADAHV